MVSPCQSLHSFAHFDISIFHANVSQPMPLNEMTFMNCIADVAPYSEMLMFVDETSQNRKTSGQCWNLITPLTPLGHSTMCSFA